MSKKIELQNVSVTYTRQGSSHTALDKISLSVDEGEFVCVVGHSGCGKTTLLHVAAGLIIPDSGKVFIDGKQVSAPGNERSIVFQHYSLFPWLSAKQNVAFGIRQSHKGMRKKEAAKMAEEFLAHVELGDVMDKYPFELSGGMQQRVAIARSFAMNSEIMLLDEPFGALDPRIRYNLQESLEELWKQDEKRKTILFVTHDIEEALVLADKIVFIEAGNVFEQMDVPFPRPRCRREIMQMPECCNMRKQLIEMFYVSQELENEAK